MRGGVISALGWLRKENYEFEASFSSLVGPCYKKLIYLGQLRVDMTEGRLLEKGLISHLRVSYTSISV